MTFRLSFRSKRELVGVHPKLRAVVEAAITDCPVDFAVHDGLRTIEEQRKLKAAGFSKTLKSKHLTGRAVDLVPYINGKLRWEEAAGQAVKKHVLATAARMGVKMFNGYDRWGWDLWHFELEKSVR